MRIGITLGDPAGIGPEIILKSARVIGKMRKNCTIYGSKKILRRTARDMNLTNQYRLIKDTILECVPNTKFKYGSPTRTTGRAALQSIDTALTNRCDILITPPIVKNVIRETSPGFTGHTEYCAQFFGTKNFAMVGMWRQIRIMLLTTHIPLRRIFKYIKPYSIAEKIILFDWGLKKYFKVRNPHIGVGALNPHAFEFSMGEDELIEQGMKIARNIGVHAAGPFPTDSLFNRRFDGYLTMYHDQAMILLKSKKDGLNFTMGLPIIRLSPLYGAALDIAGQRKAEASGLIHAFTKGVQLYNHAKKYGRII